MRKKSFALLVVLALLGLSLNSCCIDCWDDWDDWDDSCGWSSCSNSNGCYNDLDSYQTRCAEFGDCVLDTQCWADYECKSRNCYAGYCSEAFEQNESCDRYSDCSNGQSCINHKCVIDAELPCYWNMDCFSGESCINGKCVVDVVELCDVITCPSDYVCSQGSCVFVPECAVNADCSNDDICTAGRCIPCQTDKCDPNKEIECVFNSQCASGLCVDGACLAQGACAINANCSNGLSCINGLCAEKPECFKNADCGSGMICNAEQKCEEDVECRQDNQCGAGMFCVSNICVQCRQNCECLNDGDICINGLCVND